jgi:hypothetical protein
MPAPDHDLADAIWALSPSMHAWSALLQDEGTGKYRGSVAGRGTNRRTSTPRLLIGRTEALRLGVDSREDVAGA